MTMSANELNASMQWVEESKQAGRYWGGRRDAEGAVAGEALIRQRCRGVAGREGRQA